MYGIYWGFIYNLIPELNKIEIKRLIVHHSSYIPQQDIDKRIQVQVQKNLQPFSVGLTWMDWMDPKLVWNAKQLKHLWPEWLPRLC